MPSPLERFRAAVTTHAAALPPADAAGWLARHGLLSFAAEPALPAAARASLVGLARRNLAANLWRIDRFQRIADLLAGTQDGRAALPMAPLKGIYLLDTVYRDDPGSRAMGDLDLLVRREDAEEAVERLAAQGLAETAASRAAGPDWPERSLSDGELLVELHTRLGIKHGRRSSWDEVAPRPAVVHGRPVHALDDATTLVHLVAHFVKHVPFASLRWAEDVLRWSARGVDGTAAWATARRLGAARTLAAGVRALRAVAGDDLLPAVPASPGRLGGALIALTERWLWRRPATHPFAGDEATPWRRNLAALLLSDGPADAAWFLAAKTRELTGRRSA